MKLVLKSFSQDVNLTNPEDIRYFLVFDASGKEVKLPVQKDTTEALINLIYSEGNNGDAGNSNGYRGDSDVGDDVGDLAFQAPQGGHVSSGPDDQELADAEIYPSEVQGEKESPQSEEDVESL